MKSFFKLLEAVDKYQMFKNVFNWLDKIAENPNKEDLFTVGNMISKNFPDNLNAMLSDMMPTIEEIILKLPPEDQQEVKNHFARLSHQDPRYSRDLIKRGWSLLPKTHSPYEFASTRDFEDELEREMNSSHPDLTHIQKLIDNNKNFFRELGKEYIDYFHQWFKNQLQKEKNNPTLGQSMSQAIQQSIKDGPIKD